MASILKDKIMNATHSQSDSEESEIDMANKYMLKVTAGPSYDASTHKNVYVNSDDYCEVDNEFLTAKIKVRIRNYNGLPKGSKNHSPYFDDPTHAKDQYSIAFSFVPKKDLPSKDLVWGNDFPHPIRDRLPPGFNTAFKIVKEFIDPGLSCDAYADEPWLYGPALSCWFAFRIGEKDDGDFPAPAESRAMTDGADGSGAQVRQKLKLPESSDKRRKYFLDASHRQELVFEKGRCYQGDFFNPYIDFSKFALKLPGFSIGVIKYINDKTHNLRYVFKNRATGELLFVVVLTLLFGDELQQALRDDDEANRTSAASAAATNSRGNGTGLQNAPPVDGVAPVPNAAGSNAAPSDDQQAAPGAARAAPDTNVAASDAAVPRDASSTNIHSQSEAQTNKEHHVGVHASEELEPSNKSQNGNNETKGRNPTEDSDGADELAKMLLNTASIDGREQEAGFLT